MEKGHVRIDIRVNDAYDGSYSGNPLDLVSQAHGLGGAAGGAAFGRHGPTRRTPITAMLIWKPRRLRAAGHVDQLHLEGEDAYEVCETQRPFITGHNRYSSLEPFHGGMNPYDVVWGISSGCITTRLRVCQSRPMSLT